MPPRPNILLRGLEYHGPKDSAPNVGNPESCIVASGYGTVLMIGDPVSPVADGSVARTAAGGGAGIYGVVQDIEQFRDASGVLQKSGFSLPAGTTWTDYRQASRIGVIPVQGALFRAMASAAVADIAAARSLKFANVDHDFGGTADAAYGIPAFRLNIATAGTTATLQWRIHKWLEERPSNDPTLVNFQVLVYANVLAGIGGLPVNAGV